MNRFLLALSLAFLMCLAWSAQAQQTDPADLAFWQSIQNSTDPAEYRAYLEAFPNGRFAALARLRAAAGPAAQLPSQGAGHAPEVENAAVPIRYAVGTTLVGANNDSNVGDYEAILSIISASGKEIRSSVSSTKISSNQRFNQRYLVGDLKSGKVADWFFGPGIPEFRPGRTGFGISSDQLRALEAGSSASAELFVQGRGPFPGNFERIEPQDVAMKVLVDDSEVSLPAIHVRGIFGEASREFWFLDNPNAAVVLRARAVDGDYRFDDDIIKIYTPGGGAQRIAQGLVGQGRVELHGIYFDFDKATIRPESLPVLTDIAAVLRKNPSWNLTVAGHTDNIGSDPYNMALSKNRAIAVVQALTQQYSIATSRLVATGYGASQPVASNDTLEGRASNRRVELIRSN